MYPLCVLKLATGMRRSEIIGLQWRDVDLDAAEVHVERGFHVLYRKRGADEAKAHGRELTYAPKSKASRRVIALPPSACVALRDHRARMEKRAAALGSELKPEHHVFVRADFTPLRPDYVTRAFKRIAKRAGLDNLPLKNLRHSHATMMLAQGIHPKIVSDRLGHSNIRITLDTYSSPGMDLQRRAAEQFDIALNGEREPDPVPGSTPVAT